MPFFSLGFFGQFGVDSRKLSKNGISYIINLDGDSSALMTLINSADLTSLALSYRRPGTRLSLSRIGKSYSQSRSIALRYRSLGNGRDSTSLAKGQTFVLRRDLRQVSSPSAKRG